MTRQMTDAEDRAARRRPPTPAPEEVAATEGGAVDPARPAMPDQLLTDPRLDSRGNAVVRATLTQQLQQRQGNRILQRLVGGAPAPAGTTAEAPEAPAAAPSLSDPQAYLEQRTGVETLHTQSRSEADALEEAHDLRWIYARLFQHTAQALVQDADQGAFLHPEWAIQSLGRLREALRADPATYRQRLVDKVREVAAGWQWEQIFARWNPPAPMEPSPAGFAQALQSLLAAPAGPLGDGSALARTLMDAARAELLRELPGALEWVGKTYYEPAGSTPDVLKQDAAGVQRGGGPLDQGWQQLEAADLSKMSRLLPPAVAQLILDTPDLRAPAWNAYTARFGAGGGGRAAAPQAAPPAEGGGNNDANKPAAGKARQ